MAPAAGRAAGRGPRAAAAAAGPPRGPPAGPGRPRAQLQLSCSHGPLDSCKEFKEAAPAPASAGPLAARHQFIYCKRSYST